ncbi:MAG TPA: ABC transporter ATP-binding protein [Chloroflexota bacterium]|jgi:oligopeptide transport system ATP-binding protein|nr:ABC transporter ATP-binding protein [Chloroflexota bacterium]
MPDALLEVDDLTTYFFTRAGTVKAVEHVSYSINPGETLGVVGESGSGKSVTALSIMRLIPSPPGRIVAGKVTFAGRSVLGLSGEQMRKLRGGDISMIFQDPMTSLNPLLTIGRQIAESVQEHQGVSRKQANVRTAEMLRLVGMPEADKRLKSYPHEFSGGMRQRVMIAMALANNPKLLIADEPTTALDVTIQAQILDLIRALSREFHTSVILITHDLGVVAGIADRVVVMYAGRVAEIGEANDIFARPAHPYTHALLASIPRLDDERGKPLRPIPGSPPELINQPAGCPFVPRCPNALPKCRAEMPPLTPTQQAGHMAACWNPVGDLAA